MKACDITELAERSLRARGATWIRREVPVGSARADIAAVVDGRIVLVEVKGDGDSSARLKNQLVAYSDVAHTVELWLSDSVLPVGRRSWGAAFPWVDIVSAEQTAAEMSKTGDAMRVLSAVGVDCPPGPTERVLGHMHVPELRALLRSLGLPRGKAHAKWAVCRLIGSHITLDQAKRHLAATWAQRDWSQWQRIREERAARPLIRGLTKRELAFEHAKSIEASNSTTPFESSFAGVRLLMSTTLTTWEEWASHLDVPWGQLALQGAATIARAWRWVETVGLHAVVAVGSRPADLSDAMIAAARPRDISPGADAWALCHRAQHDPADDPAARLRATHRRVHRSLASDERVRACRFCAEGRP